MLKLLSKPNDFSNYIQIAQCSDIVIVSTVGDRGRVNSVRIIFIISDVEPCVAQCQFNRPEYVFMAFAGMELQLMQADVGWRDHEFIKLSTPHSDISELNLGGLVDKDKNLRGAGAELRTDAHIALTVSSSRM